MLRGGGGWKRSHGWVYTGTNGETRDTDKTTTSRTTAPALDPTKLVDSLAWEIAWDLSWVAGSRQEPKLLEAGKRAGVKRAILVLAHRGGLSYGQFAKYSLAGKVGMENTALAAKYDACGLRKLFTLGLSPCGWDPDYR